MATITNNDSASTVTINDITITEGNSMTKSATFTISRTDNLSSVSVQYKTSDGTANTSDYTTVSPNTLSFPIGGSLSKTVTVSVKGDTAVESDETFYLDLSNCTGCNLADSQGMATITNNDYLPATVTIDDVTLTEGNSGAKDFVFTISRSDNLKTVSVSYKTTDGTASNSYADYDSLSRNTLRLEQGGPLSATVTVSVNGNSVLEKDETFFVDLSNCNECEIVDSQGVGTILNDDEFIAPPQDSSRPTLIMMMRGDVANHQEVADVFKKYSSPSDLKFTSAGLVPKSIYAQLDVNNVAFGLTLEKIYQQTQNQQGQSAYIGYDPEWFEDRESSTPEAEYKDYVNSVRTASGYARDNGFKFLLTPLYGDIKDHAKEFAPYVDVVALQIPHFTRNYSTAVQTAVNDIKSVNPDAIVLVQLIPTNDTSSKLNNDVEVIIDAYNSVRDHVDGVLVYYYDSPNPAPILDQFYQGIGMVPNQ
jgi:disulfide oxidoreductase YuzD